jgi:hypothetical protein
MPAGHHGNHRCADRLGSNQLVTQLVVTLKSIPIGETACTHAPTRTLMCCTEQCNTSTANEHDQRTKVENSIMLQEDLVLIEPAAAAACTGTFTGADDWMANTDDGHPVISGMMLRRQMHKQQTSGGKRASIDI